MRGRTCRVAIPGNWYIHALLFGIPPLFIFTRFGSFPLILDSIIFFAIAFPPSP
jgi:hypothetical protein